MMWNDGFLFAFAALTAIGIWISIGIRHSTKIQIERKPDRGFDDKVRAFFGSNLFWIVLAIAFVIFLLHGVKAGIEYGRFEWPGVGAIIALIVGGVIGSFGARFTWSLFGARFGRRDPVIGIVVILILIIVYSFPLYRAEFSAIWAALGLRSLKAPGGVELTFSDASPIRSGSGVLSTNNGKQDAPKIVSNPSNPQPGLKGLKSAVSNDASSYIVKDDQYIAYFKGHPIPSDPDHTSFIPSDSRLRETLEFLVPAQTLVGCLSEYANIFPDAELVLVDTKPVLQWFFRLHTYSKHRLSSLDKSPIFENPMALSREFRLKVTEVRNNVLIALGVPNDKDVLREHGIPSGDIASIPDSKLLDLLPKEIIGEGPLGGEIGLSLRDKFVVACNQARLKVGLPPGHKLQILQPYTSIALANLLIAHGSPDQAIIVLAEWLDLWKCARGEAQGPKCGGVRENKEARDLPPWLGLRAEFELSTMLYRLVGEGHRAYRDFMRDFVDRFEHYLENPITVVGTATEDFNRSISMREEARRCASPQPGGSSSVVGLGADRDVEQVKAVRVTLLRTLVADESSLLRAELLTGIVSDRGFPELETLYERALLLSKFTPECLDPKHRQSPPPPAPPDRKPSPSPWVAVAADYQITAGLLALAVADRYQLIAASTDERQRAFEIRAEGKRLIEHGYQVLKPIRNEENAAEDKDLPSKQVFTVNSWEASCLLAERALDQLRQSNY
jgi:hypothetical protein